MFLNSLTDISDFVLDIKVNFTPASENSTGGLIVKANEDNYLVLEEYFDGLEDKYIWYRLIRDNNRYTAFWSSDGVVWNLIGVQYFGLSEVKIGAFFDGEGTEEFKIDYVRVFSSNVFQVTDITEGTKVELLNSSGVVVDRKTCLKGRTGVSFSMDGLPIPFYGRVRIILPYGKVLEDSNYFNIYLGDAYKFYPSLDLFYLNSSGEWEDLKANFEEFLGYYNSTATTFGVKMKLKNFLPKRFLNIKVDVIEYKGSGHSQFVWLAEDSGGVPGTLVKSLNIAEILPDAESYFWLVIQKPPDFSIDKLYFGLNINSNYEG